MFPKQHRILFVVTAVVLRIAIYAVMLFKMFIVLAMPQAILLTIAELVVLALVWRMLGWNEPKSAAVDAPVSASVTHALGLAATPPRGATTQAAAATAPGAAPDAPSETPAPVAPEPVAMAAAPVPLAELTAPFTRSAPTPRTRDTSVAASELADALDQVAAIAQPGTARISRPLPSWQPPALPAFAAAQDDELAPL